MKTKLKPSVLVQTQQGLEERVRFLETAVARLIESLPPVDPVRVDFEDIKSKVDSARDRVRGEPNP